MVPGAGSGHWFGMGSPGDSSIPSALPSPAWLSPDKLPFAEGSWTSLRMAFVPATCVITQDGADLKQLGDPLVMDLEKVSYLRQL